MARVILEMAGEDVFVGGSDIEVFGTTAGGETITVNVGSNVVFDGSFAAGGDEIELPGGAGSYSASISGSRVILTSTNGTTVSIPVGTAGIDIDFGGGDVRTLQIVDGEVVIGDQVVEPGATPTELEAGIGGDLEFTTEADSLTGTDGDDVFDAGLGVALGGLFGVQTLQGADEADGGAGVDTLNAELNSTGTTANPELTGIEVYNLTSFGTITGDDFGTSTLNLARATGYEQLWNIDSTGNLTLTNVGEVAVLGLDGVQAGTTYTVVYDGLEVEEQTIVGLGNGFPPAGDVFEDSVAINIQGVAGDIGTLNLDVSGGNLFYLEGEAATAENLDIDGDGDLGLVAEGNFTELETLDTTGYEEDLSLDISGSGVIEAVSTGDGDDRIVMASASFSADTVATTVDLGAGYNTLVLEDSVGTDNFSGGGVNDGDEISNLDFTAGVSNVQVLNIQDVQLSDGDDTLALDGIEDLVVLELDELSANGSLTVSGGPSVLTIEGVADEGGTANLDFDGELLTVNDTADLTLLTEGEVDVELSGDTLENVDVVGEGVDLVMNEAANLVDLDVTATATDDEATQADADVTLTDDDGDDEDGAGLESLEDVTVVSEDGNATLTMTGSAGTAAQAALAEIWRLTITDAQQGEAGNVIITSDAFSGGGIVTDYSVESNFDEQYEVAGEISADLNASGEAISSTFSGPIDGPGYVDITFDAAGDVDDPSVFATGGIAAAIEVLQQGTEASAAVPGSGFASLTTATVLAAVDATVSLTDVYGSFDLLVVAGEEADVELVNTAVISANVTASVYAQVDIYGDTFGAAALETLTITADDSDVFLDDDLASLDVITLAGTSTDLELDGDFGTLSIVDLTAIVETANVYASDGDFETGPGGFVEYLIGDTDDVFISTNEDAREVFTFTSADFGTVVLGDDTVNGEFEVQDDFDTDPSDRIDLSALGFTGAGQLSFEINGDGDLVITDLEGGPGEFSGTIIVDIEGSFTPDLVDDFAANNIIFA